MLDGIFQHQDSNGGSGLISDGDIQWMTAVYSSSESLTGDLEAYDDDAGVLQVYDAQARSLPLTWQAPDPRRRWAGQARLGPPQQGQEDRLHDTLRRFLPLIGRADLAEAPVLDLQAAAQAISDQYGGRRPVQDGDGPAKGGRPPLPRTLNSYCRRNSPRHSAGRAVRRVLLHRRLSRALTTVRDPEQLDYYSRSVAASWLAGGLDPNTTTFYRQSDCPETFELTWILACVTAKGLMNRAHAYKAARDRNREAGLKDLDAGVNAGTYYYPVLMAADILIMQADVVPVGKDQVQHVEYARDIAERFNVLYGDHYAIKLLRDITSEQEDENALPGLDGRKMSKSYGNAIPLFSDRDELRGLVRRLKSDSTPVDAPKDPDSSTLFAIYAQFAGEREQSEIRKRLLAGGLGWAEMKEILFERLDAFLSEPRKRYNALMEDRKALDEILELGAEKARARAQVLLRATRAATGIR